MRYGLIYNFRTSREFSVPPYPQRVVTFWPCGRCVCPCLSYLGLIVHVGQLSV